VSDWLICGVDDSEGAREAARWAHAFADRLSASLALVHVARVPVVAGASSVPHGADELRDGAEAEARRVLARIAAETGCLAAERHVELGETVSRLAAIAADRRALLLVVGSRGHGPLGAVLHGSTALRLLRHAPCPVLVVPARASSEAPAGAARDGSSAVRLRAG
jgi:nucleotide-binding universal stress UspA family protein